MLFPVELTLHNSQSVITTIIGTCCPASPSTASHACVAPWPATGSLSSLPCPGLDLIQSSFLFFFCLSASILFSQPHRSSRLVGPPVLLVALDAAGATLQPDSHACRASAVSVSLCSFPSNGTLLPEDSMSASFPAGSRLLVPGVAPAWSAVRPDGLPTPPADMTSLAYSNAAALNSSSTAEGSAGKQYALHHHHHHHHHHAQPHLPCPPLASSNAMSLESYSSSSRQHPPSRAQQTRAGADGKDASRNPVAPYLQIPPTIRSSQGNLAELAAQVGRLPL